MLKILSSWKNLEAGGIRVSRLNSIPSPSSPLPLLHATHRPSPLHSPLNRLALLSYSPLLPPSLFWPQLLVQAFIRYSKEMMEMQSNQMKKKFSFLTSSISLMHFIQETGVSVARHVISDGSLPHLHHECLTLLPSSFLITSHQSHCLVQGFSHRHITSFSLPPSSPFPPLLFPPLLSYPFRSSPLPGLLPSPLLLVLLPCHAFV